MRSIIERKYEIFKMNSKYKVPIYAQEGEKIRERNIQLNSNDLSMVYNVHL